MKTLLSIDRAVRILDTVVAHPGEYTLSGLSKLLDMPVTTLHGFCATMEHWKLLQKDPAGRFQLGCRFLHYAFSCSFEQQLNAQVHPYLVDLSRRFDETFHIGVLRGEHIIYIDKAESQKPYRMTSVIGTMDPYQDSAIGLQLYARQGAEIPEEYLSECNDILRDGYCLKFEPHMHAYCLGVELQTDPPDLAGVSAVLPDYQCTSELVQEIVAEIRRIPLVL